MGQNGAFVRYMSGYGSAAVRCQYTGVTRFYNKSGNNAPVESMRIDGDGDVGIGENNPGANNEKLTVREDIAAASGKAIISIFNLYQGTSGQSNASTGALEFTFKNHNASHNWWGGRIGCFNTDNYNQYTYLRFDTASQGNAAEKMRLDSSGNLHLRSATTNRIVLGSSGGSIGTLSNSENWIRGSGTMVQLNTAGGDYGFEVLGDQKMKLDSNGNLELRSATQCRLTFGSAGSSGNNTNWVRGDGNDLMYNCITNHKWEVSGTERVRIDSDGRFIVGGGTHAGGGQLVVMGGNINNYGCVTIGAKITNPTQNVQFSQVRFAAGSGGTSKGAAITAQVPGGVTWSENSSQPTDLVVSTCNNASASLTEKFRIYAGGSVRIKEELQIERSTNQANNFTTSGKVLHLPGYQEFHYTWSGQSSYTIDLTCASYFHAEFIYTQHQTNGGTRMQYYVRGKWANNHTTHTGIIWEWHGDDGGLDVQFNVSDQSGNGNINMRSGLQNAGNSNAGQGYINGGGEGQNTGSANGRLRISETYSWGSVAGRALIVKVYYGSFSISKT